MVFRRCRRNSLYFGLSGFRDRPVQPLRHLSESEFLTTYAPGGKSDGHECYGQCYGLALAKTLSASRRTMSLLNRPYLWVVTIDEWPSIS